MRDRVRAGARGGRGEIGRPFEAAEEVRLLEDHGGASARARAELVGIGRPTAMRHLDDLEAEASANVLTTWRTCGFSVSASTTFERPLVCFATKHASAATVVPSYPDAFDTSIPVSSQITVWYSKIACSTPWLISGWYGVYAVRNSPRESSTSTTAGT